MIIGQDRSAIGVLDPVKLEPGPAMELAAVGYGLLDRRELQKVVLAFARAGE